MDKSGQAFPSAAASETGFHYREGLTKRELFAAMAMQGMLAADDSQHPDYCARHAVRYANALLAALKEDSHD